MPIGHAQITVGSEVVTLCPPHALSQHVHVRNNENGNNKEVYLGNGDVTTDTGHVLGAGESMRVYLGPGDTLMAVASGNRDVSIMKVTQD